MHNLKTVNTLAFLQQRSPQLQPESSATADSWQHWRLARDDEGVAWLSFDRRGSSVNSLNEEVLEELQGIVVQLQASIPEALILLSAKQSGFCAGADIGMFRGFDDASAVEERLRRAHEVVDRLASLPCKTIAMIHGVCLGGGLELALACDMRIATADSKLGFPEVQLGLHPGLGGSFRSTALIGPVDAMQLMLTGKSISAQRAKKLGLIDAVTEARHARAVLLAARTNQLPRRRSSPLRPLFNLPPSRALLAGFLQRATSKKVSPQHYPAPFQLIDLWRRCGGNTAAMQNAEIRSFSQLVSSVKGQNLVRVFFLREALKQQADTGAAQGIGHVHVIGAGAMGGDIAAWCAFSGFTVSLSDRDSNMIADAVRRANLLARRKRLRPSEHTRFLDRLIADPSGYGIARADLIIEAVPEKIEIKRSVYDDVIVSMKADAILATNTSSIPLETLREGLSIADRFVGLHFFNPVSRMQLVEVVLHDAVSEDTRSRANGFVGRIDRLPVPVKSHPGFLVNRVLTPYLLEAMVMLDEGASAETLDSAALQFGMPVGPAELADQIGLDICLDVADTLQGAVDQTLPEVPGWIRRKVEQGAIGRKSGQGLYTWKNGRPQKGKPEPVSDQLVERLVLPLLNTCVACLKEGIVESEEILDAAMIFGTGFAPFTGGPLHFSRSRGVDELLEKFRALTFEHGERFKPDAGWKLL